MKKWITNVENKIRYDSFTDLMSEQTNVWIVQEHRKEDAVALMCGSLILEKDKLIERGNLIAAAPELLQALELCFDAFSAEMSLGLHQRVTEVIKKARGEKWAP